MRLAILWTFIALIGLAGACRNVYFRNQNIKALIDKKINGPTLLTATAFRNSELMRLFQAVVGLTIGVATIALYSSPFYKTLTAARAAGLAPEPSVLVVYRYILGYGLLLWQTALVANIWYFGVIGDRAEALRRRLTNDYLDEVASAAAPDEQGKEVTP
jgi:hypothetical protein